MPCYYNPCIGLWKGLMWFLNMDSS